MRKGFYYVFLFVLLFSCKNNNKQAVDLKKITKDLDSIFIEDQKFRSEMMSYYNSKNFDSLKLKSKILAQKKLDSSNLQRIIEIIDQVNGYPGKSLVGISASRTAFYVLQHAPDSIQTKYLNLILEASKDNELDKNLAAMFHDRYLMYNNKPQIYGSQIKMVRRKDSITGLLIKEEYLWPIADTTNIDSLRLWNGLPPLEDYLKGFGLSRWSVDSSKYEEIINN